VQPDGAADFGQAVTVIDMRFADTSVTVLALAYYPRGEKLREGWATRVPLASRNFLGGSLTTERRAQLIDETLIAKQNLPLQLLPRRGLLETLCHERHVPLLGAGRAMRPD
jgi:hypothetical protein